MFLSAMGFPVKSISTKEIAAHANIREKPVR